MSPGRGSNGLPEKLVFSSGKEDRTPQRHRPFRQSLEPKRGLGGFARGVAVGVLTLDLEAPLRVGALRAGRGQREDGCDRQRIKPDQRTLTV
jgi:hypothetical protein